MSDLPENWTDQPQPDSACVEIMADVGYDHRVVIARAYGYKPFRVGSQPSMRDYCARMEWKRRRDAAHARAVEQARAVARMMAAVPTVVKKAEALLKWVDEDDDTGCPCSKCTAMRVVARDLRNAIARARGGEG